MRVTFLAGDLRTSRLWAEEFASQAGIINQTYAYVWDTAAYRYGWNRPQGKQQQKQGS